MQDNEIGITILPKLKNEIQSVNDLEIMVGVVVLCKLDCVVGSTNKCRDPAALPSSVTRTVDSVLRFSFQRVAEEVEREGDLGARDGAESK